MLSLDKVPLSRRAKKYYKQSFRPQFNRYCKDVEQTVLIILVWGPGSGSNDPYYKSIYRKRLQIRNELRKRGHGAFFSEELESKAKKGLSLKLIEFAQAQCADLIVVMDASYGSVAEVSDFASTSINYKMLIFIDESAKDGYAYNGVLKDLSEAYKNVETFKFPQDIKRCHLLTKVIKRVDALQRIAHYRKVSECGTTFPKGDKG